jgi:hypothetical protein
MPKKTRRATRVAAPAFVQRGLTEPEFAVEPGTAEVAIVEKLIVAVPLVVAPPRLTGESETRQVGLLSAPVGEVVGVQLTATPPV